MAEKTGNLFAPITLTLYNQDDEPTRELQTSVVRWGVLKQALRLSDSLVDEKNLTADGIDQLTAFVCRVFGDKATVTELEEGADVAEMFTVFRAVIRRASSLGNV